MVRITREVNGEKKFLWNYTKMSEDAIQKFNVDENHEDDVFSIAVEINP